MGCRCFLLYANCSLTRAISYIIRKNLTIYQPPTPNLVGCRCFLLYANCSLTRAISYIIKKHSAFPTLNLRVKRCFFDISKITKPFSSVFIKKKTVDFFLSLVYNDKVISAGVMELADVTDSKSVGSDTVWVRVPPPAPEKASLLRCFFSFIGFGRVILLRSVIAFHTELFASRALWRILLSAKQITRF